MDVLKNVSLYGKKCDIEYENGVITSVKENKDITPAKFRVYPGLFDIHAHGMMGMDSCVPGEAEKMAPYMLANGVVSWCPTTASISIEQIKEVTKAKPEVEDGCDIIGFHLEGPYMNEKYKGAMNPKFLKNPNLEEFSQIKNVATITLAPETEGAMDFIRNCGVPVCIGHTDCDYDTAIDAIESGAVCLTHTFNAMPSIHHRNPGPIGAASEKEIYAQVICDGVHVHKASVLMLYKLFGADRMILISDSVSPTGLGDGEYEFCGIKAYVKNGEARLKEGNLAGSTHFLIHMVKKAIEFGISEEDAFKMASQTPYNMMGIKNRGKIAKGYTADFIITDDDINILSVVKGGRKFTF